MSAGLARHDRVWIDPAAFADGRAAAHDPRWTAELAAWVRAGRPAVARRRLAPDPDGAAPLGVCLPNARARRRLAFWAAPEAVAARAAPCALADVIGAAPEAWRPALAALLGRAQAAGVALGVYGSLAWQHMTAQTYLRAGSDIDLLFAPASRAHLARAVAMLEAWQADSPVRADGEVVFPGGGAVAWREWAGGAARVLVKTAEAAALRARGDLLDRLAP